MNQRENKLRAIRFETPDVIPMTFHINDACWHHYDQEALKDLMEQQVEMATRFGEKMVAAAQESLEIQARARDELARVFEDGFKRMQGTVETAPPARAARRPAARRTTRSTKKAA